MATFNPIARKSRARPRREGEEEVWAKERKKSPGRPRKQEMRVGSNFEAGSKE